MTEAEALPGGHRRKTRSERTHPSAQTNPSAGRSTAIRASNTSAPRIGEAGLQAPEDLSVVDFDDIPSAVFQNPALTTIRQPLQVMGTLALQQLLQDAKIDREPAEGQIDVEPALVVRSSTARRK